MQNVLKKLVFRHIYLSLISYIHWLILIMYLCTIISYDRLCILCSCELYHHNFSHSTNKCVIHGVCFSWFLFFKSQNNQINRLYLWSMCIFLYMSHVHLVWFQSEKSVNSKPAMFEVRRADQSCYMIETLTDRFVHTKKLIQTVNNKCG